VSARRKGIEQVDIRVLRPSPLTRGLDGGDTISGHAAVILSLAVILLSARSALIPAARSQPPAPGARSEPPLPARPRLSFPAADFEPHGGP